MGKALYRKYRSRSFDEVIGQSHIVKTLQNAIKDGRISHAYLFTGPRGIGKTSVARILAHEINDFIYKEDIALNMDIIEIDAASNRRVDEIRDLREKVNITPTSAKYKVYIIDEAHMLTREAFNALLKTLEEPPLHSVFILATTEVHKLPETIISRTQRFSFKPVSNRDIEAHLTSIAKKEKINIEPKALELIAEHAHGSMRDAISILDQLSGYGSKMTVNDAYDLLGLPPKKLVDILLKKVGEGDVKEAYTTVSTLKDLGVDPTLVAQELVDRIINNVSAGGFADWQSYLSKQLVDLKSSPDPQSWLEISILEASSLANKGESSALKREVNANHKIITSVRDKTKNAQNPASRNSYSSAKTSINLEEWPKLLSRIKTHDMPLYTALKMAQPSSDQPDKIDLKFEFPLHRNKIVKAEKLSYIEREATDVFGRKIIINCIVDKTRFKKSDRSSVTPVESNTDNAGLQFIAGVFGSAEIMDY